MSKKSAFFSRLILIALVVVAADAGIGGLLRHFYFRIPYGEQARVTYAADSSWQDVLVLGSSRASHHYVSTILSERLGLTCYNGGKDKQGLLYSLAMFKMVLARHRPAYVILDINPSAFSLPDNGMELLSALLPYYQSHPEIRAVVNKRSKWEPIKTYSSLYCYNSLVLQIIFNNLSSGREADAVNGYVPLNRNFSESIDTVRLLKEAAEPADTVLENAFRDIIRLSAANGCKLVVVASPYFLSPQQPSPSMEKIYEICGQEKIPFLDYNKSVDFVENKQLFADQLHLNHTGATRFTDQLCTDLLSAGITEKPSAAAPK